jgi:endonuclease/exonuclease/phosphatase family metal-dependent hydrolase
MTFNLRITASGDGINCFPYRKERILACIREENPDLIGFQEAGDDARAFLREALTPEYTVLGCGRAKDYRGESCIVAFRTDLFEPIGLTTRFLSDTPTVPGSRYRESDQSTCPRLFVHLELSAKDSQPFHFINTHLDHKGRGARALGMAQILSYAESLEGVVFLTGDMNARPDEECILHAKEWGLRDTTEGITHTFHGFGTVEKDCKIDYIFTNGGFEPARRVEDVPVDGVYISDHYPVVAMVEI